MAFRFRLEPLLRHRSFLRDRCRAALASAEALRDAAREALAARENEALRLAETCEEETRGGLPAARFVALHEHLAHIRKCAAEAAAELSERAEEALRRRAELLEAEAARETLSHVKDERREEWRFAQASRARKALDEAAILRSFRPSE